MVALVFMLWIGEKTGHTFLCCFCHRRAALLFISLYLHMLTLFDLHHIAVQFSHLCVLSAVGLQAPESSNVSKRVCPPPGATRGGGEPPRI